MAKRKKSGQHQIIKLLKSKKYGALILIAVVVVAILVLYKCFPEYADFIFGDGELPAGEYVGEGKAEFHFIDVGQGDGILIRTSEGDIVIDAGPSATEDDFVNYLKAQKVSKIEYLVLTHPHADHIGGADAVLEEFDVKRVIIPKTDCTTSMYMKVLGLVEKEKCEVIESKVLEAYTLGDFKMTVLAPTKITYDDYNNYSVVIRAELGNTSVLLTGDAEDLSEGDMIDSIPRALIDCDVLKAGHHGSSTSTTKEFFSKVSPAYAVISCGVDNDYGHPHRETMETFKALQSVGKLYRTDVSGSIVFTTDGNEFTVKCEK